ncbi:MAG: TIM-barrel domain-containing protein, partial [Acutalibacteraceae bacterium]
DNFKDFTIDDKAFPNFENFVKELKDDGIRLIPIIDAGVKVEDGYDIYEEGKKHNYFCKDKKGDDFKAGVWPGICCFPDFLDEKSGKWFGDKFNILTEKGIEGFWIDMNEPALFFSPESLKEAYKYVEENKKENPSCWDFFALKDKFLSISNNNDDYKNMHHLNGTVSHYDVHNLYGYKMMESVRKSLPEDTLLFSRASYIGSHRYGGIWTGDNHSWWSHILLNLRMLPSLNMCGFIYTGADCGGFNCNASRELLLRWMALSVFTPLFRNHSATGTREQEAFAFENTEDFKNIIKVRYRLIPYLYSLAEKCCNEFEMMFSPLSFTFPNDKIAREIDDQLLVGEDFMIAPVYEPNKSGRMVYLPEDMTLYKLSGDKIFSKEMNKGLHYVEIALNEVPIFLRKGKKLPLCSSANRVRDIDFTNITWLS